MRPCPLAQRPDNAAVWEPGCPAELGLPWATAQTPTRSEPHLHRTAPQVCPRGCLAELGLPWATQTLAQPAQDPIYTAQLPVFVLVGVRRSWAFPGPQYRHQPVRTPSPLHSSPYLSPWVSSGAGLSSGSTDTGPVRSEPGHHFTAPHISPL